MKATIRDAFLEPQMKPDVRILIDVFRASTTTLALFAGKIQSLSIANDYDLVKSFADQGYRVISEVFPLGLDNSPTIINKTDLQDRKVILKTANLTTALEKNWDDLPMFIGCFNNLTAVAQFLQRQNFKNIEIIPAGEMNLQQANLEDTHCAEIFKAQLEGNIGMKPDQVLLKAHIQKKRDEAKHPPHFFEDAELAIQTDLSALVPHIQLMQPGLYSVVI